MNKTLWLKVTAVVLVAVWGITYIMPNFIDISKIPYFPGKKLTYGLDIQGGIHLVMGVDIQGVLTEQAKRFTTTMAEELKEKNASLKNSEVKNTNNNVEITLELNNADQAKEATAIIEKEHHEFMVASQEGSKVVVRFNDKDLRDFKKKTLDQAIETLRNRVDEFGVSEPSITAQGEDRILVQLPGIEDSAHAKELINKTARLEFLMVNNKINPAEVAKWVAEAEKKGTYSLATMKYSDYVKKINDDIKDKLPKDTKVLFEKSSNAENMAAGKNAYVVQSSAEITGADLKNAQVTFSQYNSPEVAMSFNTAGAKKFADITEKNVGELFAIVLDDVIYAAPKIKGRIGGGNAVIELGQRDYDKTMSEAKLISMALRAGALPAKLEQLEERTVGPSLGLDSIAKAKKAIVVGTVLLLALMLVIYRGFGVLATLALLLNGVLILAVLSSLNATLTLPGVAGIALTVGMAIDANVIIYERIKEELRRGLDLESAVKVGYSKALSAILDSNITNIAVSAILMYFGTGPVRGFGATLIIGILTSMFTAIFFTKTLADVLIQKMKIKISI
jgi:preprotein translocase subunit SecD